MPFDATDYKFKRPKLTAHSPEDFLEKLADLLDDVVEPELDPTFEWDYSAGLYSTHLGEDKYGMRTRDYALLHPECGTAGCALGYAYLVFGIRETWEHADKVPYEVRDRLFFNRSCPTPLSEVTPGMVSERIRSYLSSIGD